MVVNYSIRPLLTIFVVSICLLSCTKVEDDELWRVKVKFEDGSHVMVYHVNTCKIPKPFFAPTEKIINYTKYKFDVFCPCISEEMSDILNAISEKNINEYIESVERSALSAEEQNYHKAKLKVFDRSSRAFATDSGLKNGEIVPLKESYSGFEYEIKTLLSE